MSTALGSRMRHRAAVVVGAVGVAVAALTLSLLVGANPLPPGQLWTALLSGPAAGGEAGFIVWQQRMPRTLAGVVVGAALGAAGAMMQAFTRNALADTGLLGVGPGASLAVAVAVAYLGVSTPAGYVWWAIGGALLASITVYMAGRPGDPRAPATRLILVGVALGAVLAGITTGITLVDPDAFDRMRGWNAGSLLDRGPEVVLPVLPIVVAGLLIALWSARSLDAVLLGADVAHAQGVDLRRTRVAVIAAIALLAGGATAIAGPILFVGLVVPHLVRWLVGTAQWRVIAGSACAGAILVMTADVVGRVAVLPSEMPVGVVTAFVGAPVLIALVRRGKATGL